VGAQDAEPRVADVEAELAEVEATVWDDLDRALDRSLELERVAATLGAEELVHRARLVQADVYGRSGHTARGARILRDVNRWATEHDERFLLARSHRLLSFFFGQIGDPATALEHAVRAAEFVDVSTPVRAQFEHVIALADALATCGSFEQACERYRSAGQLAERLGDARLRLTTLNNLAYTEWEAGWPDRAAATAERMRAFAAVHDLPLEGSSHDTLARAQMAVGRYDDAEQVLLPVCSGDLRELNPDAVASALLALTEIQRRRGDTVAARDTLQRCLQLCDERQLNALLVQARREQAEVAAAEGCFADAYELHKRFHEEAMALNSIERESRARTLQAVFETTEARRDSERFRELAVRDSLTGLHNRRFVDENLPGLLLQAREHGSPLAVALVDLDHFKRVNDTCSHEVGDEVLRQVADLLRACVEALPGGLAARMGGEEFLVALPDLPLTAALDTLERLRQAVAGHGWTDLTQGLPVTVSLGATMAGPDDDQAQVLRRADHNLYAAKDAGRNCTVGQAAAALPVPS